MQQSLRLNDLLHGLCKEFSVTAHNGIASARQEDCQLTSSVMVLLRLLITLETVSVLQHHVTHCRTEVVVYSFILLICFASQLTSLLCFESSLLWTGKQELGRGALNICSCNRFVSLNL